MRGTLIQKAKIRLTKLTVENSLIIERQVLKRNEKTRL